MDTTTDDDDTMAHDDTPHGSDVDALDVRRELAQRCPFYDAAWFGGLR